MSGGSKALRGLLIEDEPADQAIVRALLDDVVLDVVTGVDESRRAVKSTEYSFILCDLHVLDSRGLETVRSVIATAGKTPVIALTSKEPEVGVQTLELGAQDFLPKDHLTGDSLRKSIDFAIRRVERDEARARIANLVASDLRDPLALMRSEIDALRYSNLPDEALRSVDIFRRQMDRVSEVVDELNQLTKL